MIRKPTSWVEIDQDFITPDFNMPRFEHHEVLTNQFDIKPKLLGTLPTRFIVTRNGKEYIVDTQGSAYARYIHRIK